jgi:hypothetical protein
VTAGQPQERTVSVRLRSMLSRGRSSTVRRLLVVGGIAAAGWLLGSAGQAQADTVVPAPVAAVVPHAALSSVADGTGLADKVRHEAHVGDPVHVQSVRGSIETASGAAHWSPGHPRGHQTKGTTGGAVPAPRVSTAPPSHGIIGDLARTLADPVQNLFGQGGIHGAAVQVSDALPVRPSAIFGELPGKIEQAVAELVSAGSPMDCTPSGISWALWHRDDAVAGGGGRRAANAVTARTVSGAPKDAGSGWTVTRAVVSQPAPGPESPRPLSPQPAGASSLCGPASADMGLGHVLRPGVSSRPTFVLPPMLGEVPPAVHAASDEPSFSPD